MSTRKTQTNKSNSHNFESVHAILNEPKNIIITMHKNPDGDALGSSLGLGRFLQKQDHHIHIISPNRYPNYLAWMIEPGEKVSIFEEEDQQILIKNIQQADLIFCLDFSNLSRISAMGPIVQSSTATKVIIDHHRDPEDFADICICHPQASSTTLLIYHMIRAFGQTDLIDKSIATSLYTGILTDTGSFHNSGTHPEAHRVAADLLEKGVDISQINKNMQSQGSVEKLKFIAHAITDRLHIIPNSNTAYFNISKKDYEKFNLAPGETQVLTNYLLSIQGINCSVLLTEYENEVRISLRSIGDYPVNEIAAKYFHGGGHKNAAGGTYKGSLSEAVKKLKQAITEAKM